MTAEPGPQKKLAAPPEEAGAPWVIGSLWIWPKARQISAWFSLNSTHLSPLQSNFLFIWHLSTPTQCCSFSRSMHISSQKSTSQWPVCGFDITTRKHRRLEGVISQWRILLLDWWLAVVYYEHKKSWGWGRCLSAPPCFGRTDQHHCRTLRVTCGFSSIDAMLLKNILKG